LARAGLASQPTSAKATQLAALMRFMGHPLDK
jgi:hypothetical protein